MKSKSSPWFKPRAKDAARIGDIPDFRPRPDQQKAWSALSHNGESDVFRKWVSSTWDEKEQIRMTQSELDFVAHINSSERVAVYEALSPLTQPQFDAWKRWEPCRHGPFRPYFLHWCMEQGAEMAGMIMATPISELRKGSASALRQLIIQKELLQLQLSQKPHEDHH